MFSLAISNQLFQQAQKILDDQTLAENLYLLEMTDEEAEKVLPDTPPSSRTSPISRGKILPPRPPRSPTTSESSDSDSESSDSDSSSDSSDSDMEEDQQNDNIDHNNNEVAPTRSSPQQQQQPTSTNDEDDDVLIIEYDKMDEPEKSEIQIPTTTLVSCYVTRDEAHHEDLAGHTQITSFVIRGHQNSYKDSEYYKTIIGRARQNIMRTPALHMIHQDGVRIRLQQPKILYSTPIGNRIQLPPQLDQQLLEQLPEPRHYMGDNERQGFVSIYFLITIDYSPIVQREIRKRENHQPNRRYQHHRQQESRKRPHHQHQHHQQRQIQAPRRTGNSQAPDRKHPRLDQSKPLTPHTTRTSVSRAEHGKPRTMTTLHFRKPIFSRLGPLPKARTESTTPDQRREQYNKAKLRRQRRRQQAALTTRNF